MVYLDNFMKEFTMVTDCAAVMAQVANASVSRELDKTYETWIRCIVHLPKNPMKSVMALCSIDELLLTVTPCGKWRSSTILAQVSPRDCQTLVD